MRANARRKYEGGLIDKQSIIPKERENAFPPVKLTLISIKIKSSSYFN